MDAATLEPALGNSAVRRLHQRQLAHLEEDASTKFDDVPTLIGEVGVPFDLDDRALYALPPKTPDYAEIYVPNIDGDRALAHSVDCLDAWDAAWKATNIASMASDARNLISTQAELIVHALALRAFP